MKKFINNIINVLCVVIAIFAALIVVDVCNGNRYNVEAVYLPDNYVCAANVKDYVSFYNEETQTLFVITHGSADGEYSCDISQVVSDTMHVLNMQEVVVFCCFPGNHSDFECCGVPVKHFSSATNPCAIVFYNGGFIASDCPITGQMIATVLSLI